MTDRIRAWKLAIIPAFVMRLAVALLLVGGSPISSAYAESSRSPSGNLIPNTGVYCINSGGASVVCGTPSATGATITPTALDATSIATGGTAVTAIAANTSTTNSRICNTADATENLFVNSVTTATTTEGGVNEPLVPGQCWYAGGRLTTAVSVNAVTTGHVFTGAK